MIQAVQGEAAQRFWSVVEKRGPDECWPYKPSSSGFVSLRGRQMRAPKAAWLASGKSLSAGCVVLHRCKSECCCNPLHLCAVRRRSYVNATKKRTSNFWSKVQRGAEKDCWPWCGSVLNTGYGQVRWKGKMRKTHSVAWELFHGAVPDKLSVLHHCDNRACCNPAHLFLGTALDNMRDCVNKGRIARGERSGNAVLTQEQVVAIRSRHTKGEMLVSLAREFGVSAVTIGQIVRRRTWKHC